MTTTELIELLKKHEKGGATGRSRMIDFEIPGYGLLAGPEIIVSSTGDGIAGAEITLELSGGTLYADEEGEREDGDDE